MDRTMASEAVGSGSIPDGTTTANPGRSDHGLGDTSTLAQTIGTRHAQGIVRLFVHGNESRH